METTHFHCCKEGFPKTGFPPSCRKYQFLSDCYSLQGLGSSIYGIVWSHMGMWGSVPASVLRILDRIQNKAIRLINDESLTANFQSLSHRRSVSSLCLFYRYMHVLCSNEPAASIPAPFRVGRTTRLSSAFHPFCVALHRHRCESAANSFFPRTARIWNKLPPRTLPPLCDLHKFKHHINKLDLSLYL